MINNFPFFRGPFYNYPRSYPRNNIGYNPNARVLDKHVYSNCNNLQNNGLNHSDINTANNCLSRPNLNTTNNIYNNPNNLQNNSSNNPNIDTINRKGFSNVNKNDNDVIKDFTESDEFNNTRQKQKSSKYNSFDPFFLNINGLFNNNEPLINISGLKIYLDDLIILALLFILYKEEVKDDILFISLILLLVS